MAKRNVEPKHEEFRKRLAAQRKAAGLTQQELADKINEYLPEGEKYVTPQNVSSWETVGYIPRLPTLKAISDILSCDADYLLGSSSMRAERAASYGTFYKIDPGSLMAYSKRPLYIRSKETMLGEWTLVDDIHYCLIGLNGTYDIETALANYDFYTTEPPRQRPLTLQKAKELDKVFIRSKGFSDDAAVFADGWYMYSRISGNFHQIEGSNIFSEHYYGSRYVAYEDVTE